MSNSVPRKIPNKSVVLDDVRAKKMSSTFVKDIFFDAAQNYFLRFSKCF